MSKKMMIVIIFTIIAVTVSYILFERAHRGKLSQAEQQIQILTVERRDLSEKIETTGTVSLTQNGDLYPAYAGSVLEIRHKAGAKVKKGELLMVIDSAALREQWRSAESSLKKAMLNLAQAERDLERAKILFNAQGITVDELENAQNQVELYREDLKIARFNQDELRQNSDGANFIAPDCRQLWIKAPFSGEISWVNVKPGEKITDQTLLLNLMSVNSIEIEAEVDESEINLIKPGQTAAISMNDSDQTEITGVVSRVGSSGTEESGVIIFPVTIKVDRPSSKLKSGMSADVTIFITSNTNALALPVNAIIKRQGKSMVNLMRDQEIELVEIQLGTESEFYVEVLSGLREGDRIVVSKRIREENRSSTIRNNTMPFGVRIRR